VEAIEKCSASKFNAKTFPAYAAPILVTVKGGKATGRRTTALRPGFESLTGDLRNDRPAIKGHGKFDGDPEEWAFDTEYSRKRLDRDKFVFTGTMLKRSSPWAGEHPSGTAS
jgi:hypothetical protein